jgi:hypothetical protein
MSKLVESLTHDIVFRPRHLTPEQLTELYKPALQQTEAQVATLWQNLIIQPDDRGRLAAYEQALERLHELEADLKRLQGEG